MLKIKIESVSEKPEKKVELYDSINRIPVSISIGNYSVYPETLYARNLNEAAFVELRFERYAKKLFEITFVTINNDFVQEGELADDILESEKYFNCLLNEEDSVLKDDIPCKIIRSKNSLCFVLKDHVHDKLNYFQVAESVYIGLDDQNDLAAVFLNSLSKENLESIFGY